MNYTTLPDGSLVYDSPISGFRSNHYTTDPTNPAHYIPTVPQCSARRIELRVLQCKRTRGTWHCEKFGLVTPKKCYECKDAVTPQQTRITTDVVGTI